MRATDKGRHLAPARGNFNNPNVLVRSWYPIARTSEVKKGKVRSFDLADRRVALYRNGAGTIHALDARCPHLGADLGHGSVVGDGVRCAFHGWQFGPDGGCRHAPGLMPAPQRRTRSYPVEEKWGFVWLFNGPLPLFELPATPPGLRTVRLPSRTIRCHPHLVIGNGLDATHFEVLHGMEFTAPPRLTVEDGVRIALDLQGRPRSALARRLIGSAQVSARFTTIGASLAWSTVFEPVRFHVLFSARPSPEGFCEPAVVAFLPRRADLAMRATALMYILLRDDDKILDGLRFHSGYTQNDAALETFASAVDAMEVS
jgi:phenylpropionate dioxygenase-like ring-hydroxylating dioxygenase large terminal subunit